MQYCIPQTVVCNKFQAKKIPYEVEMVDFDAILDW